MQQPTQQSTQLQKYSVLPAPGSCFHCGEPMGNSQYSTVVFDQAQPMCCIGCQLASQSIVDAGLASYYLDRTRINATAPLPAELGQFDAFNDSVIQSQFVDSELPSNGNNHMATFSVEGVRCSACAKLIENHLNPMPGVHQAKVNVSAAQLYLSWDPASTQVSSLLAAVAALGYQAFPFKPDSHVQQLKQEHKQLVLRMGLAGLVSMQAMMYAVAVYFGDVSGIDSQLKSYFAWVQLLFTIPVMVYGADVFIKSGWRALRAGGINMDVPVSLAIVLIFIASTVATIKQSSVTYFDAVGMFVFLLLLGRVLEHSARTQAGLQAAAYNVIKPITYQVTRQGQTLQVVAESLQVDDQVHVASGQYIACDGVVTVGTPSISLTSLNGEYSLAHIQVGDTVLAGSQNYAQPFTLRVTHPPLTSQVSILQTLKNRALADRPKQLLATDQWAQWFTLFILVASLVTALAWWFIDPSRALVACIAVLVATCPCALALAAPMALTQANNQLMAQGLLVTRGHVIDTLLTARTICFDKTGTLTHGQPQLVNTQLLNVDAGQLLKMPPVVLAASMQQYNQHPIASAFLHAVPAAERIGLTDITYTVGSGIESQINGHAVRLGSAEFCQLSSHSHPASSMLVYMAMQISGQWQGIAVFELQDRIRSDAASTISELQRQGMHCVMLTGDASNAGQHIGAQLGLNACLTGLSPTEKMLWIQQAQAKGQQVIMVGDGLNDAPALGAADISITMSGGADLAKLQSDCLLVSGQLASLSQAQRISLRCRRISRQNLSWAMVYNAAILPLAAMGYISPWLATISMALSSLLVIANAKRV